MSADCGDNVLPPLVGLIFTNDGNNAPPTSDTVALIGDLFLYVSIPYLSTEVAKLLGRDDKLPMISSLNPNDAPCIAKSNALPSASFKNLASST